MRSLASALSLARGGGKSDSNATASAQAAPTAASRLAKSRSASLFAKAPKTPVDTAPSVLSRPILTPGSSCSSEGSVSLQTPEDETMMPFSKAEEKKRWASWFAWRKQSEKDAANGSDSPNPSPPQTESPTAITAGDDHRASRHVSRQSASEDEDDADSVSDSSDSCREGSTAISSRSVTSRTTIVQARANLRTLLRNTLAPPLSPPPVVETQSFLFPRSAASLGTSQRVLSLESTMHVRRLLWRLNRQTLSRAEVQSIESLGRKPQPKPVSQNKVERKTDDDMISFALMRVGRYSRGLRKWALRPCFEQRFLVYMPNENGVVTCRGVMGVDRGLAVCELELSIGAEALAGLDLDDVSFEREFSPPLPPPKATVNKSLPRNPSPPRSALRKSSFHSSPSPLRVDHAAAAEPVLSHISSLSSAVSSALALAPTLDTKSSETSSAMSVSAVPTEPRVVRFAGNDEDPDESIPLGYALKVKRRREEKARFLEAEREKRVKEAPAREAAEKLRREAEQRRALEEQKRIEEERRRVEEEKRAREERTKAKYNEEIAAARARRENARLGMESHTNIREMHEREKENTRTYSRPAYDLIAPPVQNPRRRASDFAAPPDSSRSDSRPASIVESVHDNRRSLAPPSAYNLPNLSVDNVRSATHRRQPLGSDSRQQQQPSRPHSIASIASSPARPVSVLRTQSSPTQVPSMAFPMMPAMPIMPAVSHVPFIPPVPAIPVWNMPLLPPNAPFMMQQYSRPPSPSSNQHSRHPSPSPSPSRRQTTIPVPPSPSRRQSNLHPTTSPSGRQPNTQESASPSRSQARGANLSGPQRSRYPSGDRSAQQAASFSRGSNSASHQPSWSASHSQLQQSVSQPIYRNDRSQKPRQGSSTNLAHKDAKRRTTMV